MTSVTSGAITRYRVLALFTGVMLLILTFVVIPLQVFAHNETLVKPVSMIHGYGYMVYLVIALDLSLRARFSPLRTILIMLSGTIPFAAFYYERVVVREAQSLLETAKAKAAAKEAKAAAKAEAAKAAAAKTPEPANAE
jgi:integral membrane protein